jgi:Raf kinase inhibitor-like YbhB/YbcL family protein
MKDPAFHSAFTSVQDFKTLQVTSTSFSNNGFIPAQYTCDGINVNPPLDIANIPKETQCLALVVDDPDAPMGTWVHWLVWNIPVTHHLKEGTVHGTQGLNDFKKHTYGGPCPPSGTHRYFFKVYALDELLVLPATTTKQQLERAMSGHILAFGELTGLYKRRN